MERSGETDSEVPPAWIADMDFVVLPEIRQAVQTYADQPGLWLYLCQ